MPDCVAAVGGGVGGEDCVSDVVLDFRAEGV